jgi:hypothetical protein
MARPIDSYFQPRQSRLPRLMVLETRASENLIISHVQNVRALYQEVVVAHLWFLTVTPAVAIPRSGLRFLAPG